MHTYLAKDFTQPLISFPAEFCGSELWKVIYRARQQWSFAKWASEIGVAKATKEFLRQINQNKSKAWRWDSAQCRECVEQMIEAYREAPVPYVSYGGSLWVFAAYHTNEGGYVLAKVLPSSRYFSSLDPFVYPEIADKYSVKTRAR